MLNIFFRHLLPCLGVDVCCDVMLFLCQHATASAVCKHPHIDCKARKKYSRKMLPFKQKNVHQDNVYVFLKFICNQYFVVMDCHRIEQYVCKHWTMSTG